MNIELPKDVSDLSKEELNNLKVVMCQLYTLNCSVETNNNFELFNNVKLRTYWRKCENAISDIYENEMFYSDGIYPKIVDEV